VTAKEPKEQVKIAYGETFSLKLWKGFIIPKPLIQKIDTLVPPAVGESCYGK
jgi:hypothetical protein